jgi:hypothetical protein
MIYRFPCVVFTENDDSLSVVFPDLPSGITTFEKGEDKEAIALDTLFELVTEFLAPSEIPEPSKLEDIDLDKVEETFYHFGNKPKAKEALMVSLDVEEYQKYVDSFNK